MVREEASYNGDDTGKLISATSYTPWQSEPTATRTRTGLPGLEARMTGTRQATSRTITPTGTRTTETTTEFDQYGMATSVSETGDTAKAGDERCTLTTYARNTSKHLLAPVARVETVAKECTSTTITCPGDVIDDTRTFYDNGALGAAPTKALVTKTDRINGKGDGYDTVTSIPSTCGTAKTQLCFDAYGRSLATADAYGEITTTAYTPTSGEAPTQSVVTNPLKHVTTTSFDPLRGQPTQIKDANNKKWPGAPIRGTLNGEGWQPISRVYRARSWRREPRMRWRMSRSRKYSCHEAGRAAEIASSWAWTRTAKSMSRP
jgi:hypothetical protein